MKLRTLCLTLLFIATFALTGHAGQTALLGGFLPSDWTGTFHWMDSNKVQRVSLTLDEISESEETIVALGSGRYITSVTTKIKVRWVIDKKTRRFEMFETNPKGKDKFVIDGSHVGVISEDWKTVSATWTTTKTGKQGLLELTAQ